MSDWINAAAQLNSSINNYTTTVESRRQQKQQHKYNKELMRMSQDWQLYMWNLANEYNLPVNEVSRLLQAGINPALAFSNGGASAAPVPSSPESSAGVGNLPNLSNPVLAGQQAQVAEAQIAVAESTANKQNAEADAARASAGESQSRKALNEVEYEIRSSPEYINAQIQNPKIRNGLLHLNTLMSDLDYSFGLETYGLRVESAQVGLGRQKLAYLTDGANLRKIALTCDKLGAEISYLESGTIRERAQAKVLIQDLDIRAGDAALGLLRASALEYCETHGVADSVTGEIQSFVKALSDQYASGVYEGVYSSRAKAQTANEDYIYQKEHGQERRGYETEEIRRRGNYYRTSQWNMSINTGLNFVKTAVDAVGVVATRGMSKAGSSLITPKSGPQNLPLSPEASKVLRSVFPDVEKRLLFK